MTTFIGGENDGRQIDVPRGLPQVELIIPTDLKSSCNLLRTEYYLLKTIRGENCTFVFYRHSSMTVDECLRKLLDHYKRK